jgi:hypothetical protein
MACKPAMSMVVPSPILECGVSTPLLPCTGFRLLSCTLSEASKPCKTKEQPECKTKAALKRRTPNYRPGTRSTIAWCVSDRTEPPVPIAIVFSSGDSATLKIVPTSISRPDTSLPVPASHTAT